MKKNISIVMPVYKVESRIEKTIQSVVNQTYKDFELILIDDGSPDKSIEIAEKILKDSDVDFRILVQENSGVSAARNYGIKEAIGEYIYFLDSDDYIDESLLKKFDETIKNNNCDFVYTGYSYVDSDGNILIEKFTNYLESEVSGHRAAELMIYSDIYINMISGLYKREVLIKNKIYFDTNRAFAEDFVFTVKSLLASKSVCCIPEELAYYVKWNGSNVNVVTEKHIDSYFSTVDLLNYVNENNFPKEISKAIINYRIPTVIFTTFSSLIKNKELFNRALEFIKEKEVRGFAKKYKVHKYNISNVKYYILIKGIIYFPKLIIKYYENK